MKHLIAILGLLTILFTAGCCCLCGGDACSQNCGQECGKECGQTCCAKSDCACDLGDDDAEDDDHPVALADVPEVVKAAALAAVPGLVLEEAEAAMKDGKVLYYDLEGEANGVEYELEVWPDGKVTEIEEEEDDDDDEEDEEDDD